MLVQKLIHEVFDILAKELAIDENKQKIWSTLATPLVDEIIPYIRISMTILLVIGLLTFLNLGISFYLFHNHLQIATAPTAAL
jgi:hypothetical protein